MSERDYDKLFGALVGSVTLVLIGIMLALFVLAVEGAIITLQLLGVLPWLWHLLTG